MTSHGARTTELPENLAVVAIRPHTGVGTKESRGRTVLAATSGAGAAIRPHEPDLVTREHGLMASPGSTIAVLRGSLLGLFALGSVGACGDLLLIGHTEGTGQWVPVVLLGFGITSAAWCAAGRHRVALRIFQASMVALLLGGAAGLWLHYRANVEFARELSPGRDDADLFWTAIQGASPPSLAPATLMHLGLIGLAYHLSAPDCGSAP